MLENNIPQEYREKFKKLRPNRKMIISHYFIHKDKERRSKRYVIEKVALDLGYAVNKKGINTYVMRVIQEFVTSL